MDKSSDESRQVTAWVHVEEQVTHRHVVKAFGLMIGVFLLMAVSVEAALVLLVVGGAVLAMSVPSEGQMAEVTIAEPVRRRLWWLERGEPQQRPPCGPDRQTWTGDGSVIGD